MAFSDYFKSNNTQGQSQWDWGQKIIPAILGALALAKPGTGGALAGGYMNTLRQMAEQKRQEEEDQRRREWEDWTRKVQQERYEQELADRQRNIIQVTPEMAAKYGDTTFGFMFQPQTETQAYGTITRQDLIDAERERLARQQAEAEAQRKADEEAEKKRRWEEEMKLKWYEAQKPSGTSKKEEPTREQREFMNSLASLAGHYRSLNDYLADLNRNRDKIIQKLGSVEAYNALVEDAKTNAADIWRVKQVGEKQISSPGPQWKPGKGSPMGTLFGGAPRMLIAKNQKTNTQPDTQVALSADVQRAIQQYGSIDKAIEAGRKRGLSDSNPIMKALIEAKKKRSPKDLLASNGASGGW